MTTPIDTSTLTRLNAGTASSQANRPADELRDNFMTLLITQMKNQDPLKPMENSEMTSQLAQINTVNGIQELNASLQAINGQIEAGQSLQAAALIGQGVLVTGNRVLVDHDSEGQAHTTPFGVELDAPAENLRITITAADGSLVNRYDLGSAGTGIESFTWDGRTAQGELAAQGAYHVQIESLQGDEARPVPTLNYARVGGVTPKSDGGVMLDLGAVYGQVGLHDIKQIL